MNNKKNKQYKKVNQKIQTLYMFVCNSAIMRHIVGFGSFSGINISSYLIWMKGKHIIQVKMSQRYPLEDTGSTHVKWYGIFIYHFRDPFVKMLRQLVVVVGGRLMGV